MEASDKTPSAVFWAFAVLLLIWGLGGTSIYVAYLIETPQEFAASAETAAHRDAYADYVADIPAWAIAIGMIAAAARLLGAIALLLRRAWALPLYVVSLTFFLAALYRAFVLANAGEVMGEAHIAVEAMFVGLNLFAIWFAYDSKARGLLR
jgi:hypothetical protein